MTKKSTLITLVMCANLFVIPSIQAKSKNLTIGLIGDSTVAGSHGWGAAFAEQLAEKVKVINSAQNGGTLESLSPHLDKLIEWKPDYIIIQFGHNDMTRFTPDEYGKNLKAYVERIQRRRIKAVVFSPLTRRNFDSKGTIAPMVINDRTLVDYAREAERIAQEMKVPFMDLNAISIAHHNKLGPEKSAAYDFKPGDTTHLNKEGAKEIAALIIKELRTTIPSIAKYLGHS